MHEGLPPVPPVLPRPPAQEGQMTALADRLRSLRGDPRVGAVAVVAVALAAGAFWFRSATVTGATGGGAAAASSTAPGAGPASSSSTPIGAAPAGVVTTTAPVVVVVHVAGAVNRPGVVTLPAGSRVVDAIDAAGGGLVGADLDRLNLAALLVDGARVLVSRVGDPPTPTDAVSGVAPQGDTTEAAVGPLDLNAATQDDLEELPGIGPTLASAILAERSRRGGFTDGAQLQQVPGFGESRYAQIRDLVAV